MLGLPLEDIQGFILRGYGMDFLRLLVLRVADPTAARRALGKLPVTNSNTWDTKPDACINVAFTFEGLQALGLPADSLASFPEEFRLGVAARADILGDTGNSAPAQWRFGRAGDGTHVLVALSAQTAAIRETATTQVRALWNGALVETFVQDGDMLPGNVGHFGYRDGFAQPTIDGGPPNPVSDAPLTPAPSGEFVLGSNYPSQFADFSFPVPTPAELGTNGSFVAFRILAQDCAAFDQLLKDAPAKFGIESEKLAAKLVGRWRNGTPLELSPDTDSPNPPIGLDTINQYDYTADLRGNRCPIGAHMRRNNPRNSPIAGGGGLKHRIVRRGLPYGPPYDPAHPNDGIERGLVGIFIAASLKDSFEFLMKDWVNGSTFAPGLTGTKDPILGDNSGGTGKLVIPVPNAPAIVVSGFSRFAEVRASAYGFLPSLSALQYIARLA